MKKTLIIVLTALLFIGSIGGYLLIDSVFPKADPISCPKTESITSISLSHNDDTCVTAETEDFETILQNIRSAIPTRRMSVNDYPAVKNYYTVKIDTPEREFRYYIYQENSQIYVELPYEGVYKADPHILNLVAEYF